MVLGRVGPQEGGAHERLQHRLLGGALGEGWGDGELTAGGPGSRVMDA